MSTTTALGAVAVGGVLVGYGDGRSSGALRDLEEGIWRAPRARFARTHRAR